MNRENISGIDVLSFVRNILSGASKISIDVSTEIFFGRPAISSAAVMRANPLFIWYLSMQFRGIAEG